MATASDDFNRTDEEPIAGNWETLDGTGLRISTNQCDCGDFSGNPNASGWKASTNDFGDNQFSQATISGMVNFDNAGLIVRGVATGGGSYYGVFYRLNATQAAIFKVAAGVYSELTTIAGAIAAGSVLRIEAETSGANCLLRVYDDGVQIGSTYTDSSSPLTGGQPGMFYEAGNSGATKLDDWSGGDLGGGGGSAPRNLMLLGVG